MQRLTYAALTDAGPVRDENQDAVLAEPPVFLVADGIGGQAGGALASAAIVAEFRRLVGRTVDMPEVMEIADAAHRGVVALHAESPGAGSTMVALVAVRHQDTDQWLLLNVGDSRCYLVHEEDGQRGVTQLTVDHSLVQEMIDAGVLDPADAAQLPLRNVITRAVGSERQSEIDVWLLARRTGQRLLLCSDGLTNAVPAGEVEELLLASPDPATACQGLLSRAVGYGARDNVSVVVVDVGDGR